MTELANKRFRVQLCTEVWEYRTYEVEAPTPEAAIELAKEINLSVPEELDYSEIESVIDTSVEEVTQ